MSDRTGFDTRGMTVLAHIPTPGEVLDKLAALGSARQIADHLAEQGITGWPRVVNRCPISQYVHAESGGRISINVVQWDWWDYPGRGLVGTGGTPRPVGEFVKAFDDGQYPELDVCHTADGEARR